MHLGIVTLPELNRASFVDVNEARVSTVFFANHDLSNAIDLFRVPLD